MLEEKIKIIREELNKSIDANENYEKIYKLSVDLDNLIAKYYMEKHFQECFCYSGDCFSRQTICKK